MFVVTFYSFKGGVGRTHAAVNVAVSLADAGLQVLLVDFDLEAPGLTYLSALAPKPGDRKGGVAELIADSWEAKQTRDPKDYLYRPDGFDGRLAVMPAGAVGTQTFHRAFSRTREFLAVAFDRKHGAPGLTFFRDLKRAWESLEFDYALVDSRTGLTDIGGVCTRLLPDLLVLLFGLGEQGLDGVKQVLGQVGEQTLYGDHLEVKLAASMLPAGEEALREKRLALVERVLGRRPDLLLPIFEPLFLEEDVKHIENRLSPLAQAYRALRDAIREANRWDVRFRLAQARLRVADADVKPLEKLVNDLLFDVEADRLPSASRWQALSDAAVTLLQAPAQGIEAKLKAVTRGTSALREILARLDRHQYRELYAMTLNNLASALQALPARDAEERGRNLREAVGYYKEALEVRTKDRYPVERAGTLNNLANALRELPARDAEERGRNLREAVGYYKEALGVYTKDRYPVDWAMTLNNLASALQALPARDAAERGRNLREAVGYYKEALGVRTKDRYPHLFAETAANLGMLLFKSRGTAEAKVYLEAAWELRDLLPDRGERIESFLKGQAAAGKGKAAEKRRGRRPR